MIKSKFSDLVVKAFCTFMVFIAVSSNALAGSIEQLITEKIQAISAGIVVESVEESPWTGMYEVTLNSGEVIFSDKNAQYMVLGQMFNLSPEHGFANLTQQKFERKVALRLAAIDPGEQIIYAAKGEEKAVISVFTDISCYYCKKLHKALPELQENGVTIKYLAFPRAGIGSEVANQMSSIWCAKDPAKAMDLAKATGSVKALTCDDPVASQYELARQLGVNATPTIFTETGAKISGFASAESLLQELGVFNLN